MTESKKEWVTPELIVLVRSKPEEAVLAACKTGALKTIPGDNKAGCMIKVAGQCTGLCSRVAAS